MDLEVIRKRNAIATRTITVRRVAKSFHTLKQLTRVCLRQGNKDQQSKTDAEIY